jgi:hypothetical protein
MHLGSLRVLHLPKGPNKDLSAVSRIRESLPGVLHLDSCQRLLWACRAEELEAARVPAVEGLEIFEGADGYRFLLRVATGLESQIVGETDIFGQFKEAWRKCAGGVELGVLMQKLFEDTKDIRSRYLQNLGGASYGSLVRLMLNKALKQSSPGPTLIVGAGQLAQSVAPYLLDQEIWLLNRSAESLAALHAELLTLSQGGAMPRIRVISKEEEAMAWREAAAVVVCIPFDSARDFERVSQRAEHAGPVIHLGGHREEAGAWNTLPDFQALDDLFALKKSQGDVRMTQVQQAARACDEKAKLRTLGASVTIPHGWEDLAVFA